jgi:putative lumazine-binding protein
VRRGGAAVALLAVAALLATPAGAAAAGTPAVRHSINGYFDALARHDAPGTCAHLTKKSREKLAEFGKDKLKLRHASCAATLRALFRSRYGGPKGGHRRHRVRAVTIHGRIATAKVQNVEGQMRLERAAGRWLIDSEPTGETG